MAKSKLTKERHDEIVQQIKAGNYNNVAAAAAGIDESTFYRWLEQGEQAKSGRYRKFYESIKKAEAKREANWIRDIDADPSWQSKAWLLERRFPERWGKRDSLDVQANVRVEDARARLQTKLDHMAKRVETKAHGSDS